MRIWTVSNMLSVTRVFLVIPIAFLLLNEQPHYRLYALGLMVLAVATDLLDGMVARRLHQVTELGKIIDPLADKIAVVVVAGILTIQHKLPVWFFATAVARDVIIFFGGMYVKITRGITLQSTLIGKWAVTVLAALIIIAAADGENFEWLKTMFLVAGTFMLICSFVAYAKRFFEIVVRSEVSVSGSK